MDLAPLASLIFITVYAGLLFLPFSTGASDKSVVISFGLPFFLVAGYLVIMYLLRKGFNFAPQLRATLFLSTMFAGVMTVTAFFSLNVIASLARVLPNLIGYLIALFILSFVSEDTGKRLRCLNKMTQALAISGAILAVYFSVNFFVAVKNNSLVEVIIQRYTGGLMSLPWGASNVVVAPLFVPLFAQFARQYLGDRSKLGNLIIVASIITAVIISQSRTVLLLLIIAFLTIAALKQNVKFILILALVVIASLSVLYQYDDDVFNFIVESRVTKSEDLSSFNSRPELWQENILYFLRDPLSFAGYYGSPYTMLGVSSHNILLTTLVEQGIAGFCVFVLLVTNYFYCGISACFKGNALQRKIAPVFLLGMAMMLVNLQLEDANFTQQYTIYFWIYFGISVLVFFLNAGEQKSSSIS